MLSYAVVLRRSLITAALLLIGDFAVALLPFSTIVDVSPIGVAGDLMLAEVALFFIIAGILDFASSVGMAQFRKAFLASKEAYSPEKRKERERTAMVFLFTGMVLLIAMVLLMVYDLSVSQ